MPKIINYALVLPKAGNNSSFDVLLTSYVESFKYFLEREHELKGRTYRGAVEQESGTGTGAGQDSKGGGSSKQGAGGSGRKKIRGGYASSVRAIATRRAKFGASKLKVGTQRKLESKGFQIGKPTTVPRRSGQNKPKGSV